MKFYILNNEPVNFYNTNGDLTGQISISASGDMTIRPTSGSGAGLILGNPNTVSDVEFGSVAAPVSLTLLGGGTLSSNGNTLTIGNASTNDTVRINNVSFSQSLALTGSLSVTGSTALNGSLTVSGSLVLNNEIISAAWTSYTPTWSTDGVTQPVLGNGSITGAYKQIGKTVFVRVRLYYGTTTTSGTGTFYFSLPITASSSWGIQMPVSILDNGNAWYQANANGEYGGFTTKTALIGQSAGGANSSQGVTGVFPFTFGNLDSIQFNGSYECI